MTDDLIVHISDHNDQDRVFTVPRQKGLDLLLDESKTPRERMLALWQMAREEGDRGDGPGVNSDPRVSEMDEADLFLPWPVDAMFGTEKAEALWREALAEGLDDLDE